MTKNIIVISHRRSGTHLTIDAIRNNFAEYKKHKFVTLNEDINNTEFQNYLFDAQIHPRVIKTHFLPNFKLYTDKSIEIENYFINAHLIYVYRNGLDVMVSLYEYMRGYDADVQKMEFKEFIQTFNNFDNTNQDFNRIEFWQQHIKSWQNSEYAKNILYVKFEDFQNNYQGVIKTIAEKFELKLPENIVDIRLTKSKIKNKKIKKLLNFFKGVKTTSVSARKGTSGDFKNYFDEETLELFLNYNREFMNELDYKTN